MAQDTEPLLGPLPDPTYPGGWPIGSSEGHGTPYYGAGAAQELLHKPHAFALMHGNKGAKIAYGQLHWRVDCFTMVYVTDKIEVTVEDHVQHVHEFSHTHEHEHLHETTSHTHIITSDGYVSHNHSGATGDAVTETDTAEGPNEATTSVPNELKTDVCEVDPDADPPLGSNEHNEHTVKLPKITYCNQSYQEGMAHVQTTTPKVKKKDGDAMDPKWGETKYHELDKYGTVYLVWQVDIEQAGSEVIECWVQVGKPEDTSTVSAVSSGNNTTNRRNEGGPHDGTGKPEGEEDNCDKGIFYIELGTVKEDDHVEQKVSSDVNWTATVMDRELTTAYDAAPTFTYTP